MNISSDRRRAFTIRQLLVVVFAVIGPLMAVLLYDRSGTSFHGVGGTNLDVEFTITDADSSEPIENASIEIRSEAFFYDGAREEHGKTFELRTDKAGKAHRVCRNNWFTDLASRLRFSYHYVVRIPRWYLKAAAPGYESCGEIDMNAEFSGKAIHLGPMQDVLKVEIALKKR